MSKRSDAETVRQAAKGQWMPIISALGGLNMDQLSTRREVPCPKCGGNTRFRVIDEEAGACYCSHCFSEKNGDGFAAIMWLTGCDFPSSVDAVADHLGIKPVNSKDPAKSLQWMDWNESIMALFLSNHPGIKERAVVAAGGKLAKFRKSTTVVAFPIIGDSLDTEKPVGWVVMDIMGQGIPTFDRNGQPTGTTKKLVTHGSGHGLLGVQAIAAMKAKGVVELAWKCEGVTDMLALTSVLPENMVLSHVVVTNSNGTKQKPGWMGDLLSKFNCNILHDADKPGQEGAANWTQVIAAASELETKNVQLPYKIAATKGKDVRDYLAENHDYDELLALAEGEKKVEVAKTDDGEIDYTKSSFPIQEGILKRLKLEILYENEAGHVRVFSTLLRKSTWIRNLGRMTECDLLQMAGAPVKFVVTEDGKDPGTYTFGEVREAIALMASSKRGENSERGVGVWQGVDDYGANTESIVIINKEEAARYNGDKVLRRVLAPRVDGLVLDLGSRHKSWYDFDVLEKNIEKAADPEWCAKQISYLESVVNRWRWKDQENSPLVVSAMIVATWIQTVWEWRPLISISGESGSGKSMFFKFLGSEDSASGLFGNLALAQSHSTEAGIRQSIGNTAKALICDEFEASKERAKVLKLLRDSTRGQVIKRGTAGDQVGKSWKMQHIAWVAATETGLTEQPDLNRFIQADLLPAKDGKNSLVLPKPKECRDLGQKLLAIGVRHAIASKELADELKSTTVDGVIPRAIESYSVPAAVIATALGYSFEKAQELLLDMMRGVEIEEHESTDQDDLLDCILSSRIRLQGGVTCTVAQMIQPNSTTGTKADMEAMGFRLTKNGDLFIRPQAVRGSLLRDTEFESKRIDKILLRVSGAARDIQRVASRAVRGVTIPRDQLRFSAYSVEDSIDSTDEWSEDPLPAPEPELAAIRFPAEKTPIGLDL